MFEPTAARAALNTYAARVPGERAEDRQVQATDLLVDLLLMFEDDTAHAILAAAERRMTEERPGVTPRFVGV
ncbi:hypothetical protein ACGF3G_00655 [Streptomyces sp. NPDC048179]|uniref:hypothetical protein n=1 Tax=Streptomyces sp. NPDC048179 TaxID=3365506 RepID=UPI00370FE58B